MQLLISVTNAVEARAALAGGADIIDVKNPAEGALGAASVHALQEVQAWLLPHQPLSAALGEAHTAPGAWALAAYGAAALGAQYVKIGLRMTDAAAAITLLRAVRAAVHRANSSCRVIAVGYADATRIGALPWSMLPELAHAAQLDGCLIDTAIKDGRTLFDHCTPEVLAPWLADCRTVGLTCALAGALRLADAPLLRELQPDIAGFRSAACRGDRVGGHVDAELVAGLREALGGAPA